MDDIRVTPLRCGTLTAPGEAFVAGTEGDLELQVWAFAVEHPRGTAVFDTGMHPQVRTDAAGRLGGLAGLFTIGFDEDDDVVARLTAAGIDPSDVSVVISSHLHFDHAGGNAGLTDARVVVQRREVAYATGEGALAYVRDDWDTGQDLELVDGEHDVFGDGRVRCLPTYGHTAGHQSLVVSLEEGDLVLTADACYLRDALERRSLPAFSWDRDAQMASFERFAALEADGATLVFGHDPTLSPAARRLLHRPG